MRTWPRHSLKGVVTEPSGLMWAKALLWGVGKRIRWVEMEGDKGYSGKDDSGKMLCVGSLQLPFQPLEIHCWEVQ